MDELTDRDRAILAFEENHPRHTAVKEDTIRVKFGLMPARYYQLLDRVMDNPAAVRAEPMLVNSLLRERDRRGRMRAERLRAR